MSGGRTGHNPVFHFGNRPLNIKSLPAGTEEASKPIDLREQSAFLSSLPGLHFYPDRDPALRRWTIVRGKER